MWFRRTLVCSLIVWAGCKGELSLSSFGGGAKKPSSPQGQNGGQASGGGVTAPVVGKMEAGKAPPWCPADYKRNESDSNARFFKSYYDSEGWGERSLEKAAMAACDKPNDGERQKQLAEWAAMYKQSFAATDQDFVVAMTFGIQSQDERNRLREEQCSSYNKKDPEASAEQLALRGATGRVLGCGRNTDDSILYWLDRPQIQEVHRVALLQQCIQGDPEKDERMRGEFAFCMVDMKKLDRAAFDRELAAMKLNLYGRLVAAQNFGIAKINANVLLKRYAELAKDEDWQRLLAAPEKGWASWMKSFDENKATFEVIRDFERKAAKGSKKAVAGCGATLRPLVFEHLAKRKPKTPEEAQAAMTDVVGYPLMVALMRCDAAEGNYLPVSMAQDLFMSKAKARRGPRFESYDATLAVLNDIRADREKFPLERTYPNPPDTGRSLWYKAYEQTFNKIGYDKGTGQIKDVKPKGDVVQVTFKTVKWREQEAYDCRNTRRIYRIRDDGTLEYEQVCKYKTVTRSSTLEPVSVPADFAKGLKPGMMVDLTIDTGRQGKSHRLGIPKAVWKDTDKKKFAGMYGVVL